MKTIFVHWASVTSAAVQAPPKPQELISHSSGLQKLQDQSTCGSGVWGGPISRLVRGWDFSHSGWTQTNSEIMTPTVGKDEEKLGFFLIFLFFFLLILLCFHNLINVSLPSSPPSPSHNLPSPTLPIHSSSSVSLQKRVGLP